MCVCCCVSLRLTRSGFQTGVSFRAIFLSWCIIWVCKPARLPPACYMLCLQNTVWHMATMLSCLYHRKGYWLLVQAYSESSVIRTSYSHIQSLHFSRTRVFFAWRWWSCYNSKCMYEHMHVYLYNVVFDCISLIRTFHLSEQNVCGIWPMGFG